MNKPVSPADFAARLVSTKFAPPRLGWRDVGRTRLLAALRREQHRKLTLVTGGAGFGKTILLAQWRQELMRGGFKVAWLSLTEDEKDLAGFRTHLFAACGRLSAGLQLAMEVEADASCDAAIAGLVNGLTGIDEDLYLILDDYHRVEDPDAHRLVRRLVELGPGNLHLVVAARSRPPIGFARLRALGDVADVGDADLAFALDETCAFLEQHAGTSALDADEAVRIHDFALGWPAALRLIADALGKRAEPGLDLPAVAWRASGLATYLDEEVVGSMPSTLCDFMESLSILGRFSAPLAAAITGRADAAALIERLEDEKLPIMRTEGDDRKPWFRFHPLFAEYLAIRLSRRDVPLVDDLHRRAGKWFADGGLVIEAVRHCVLSGDLASAVAILQHSVPTRWKLSYVGPLLRLIDNLPIDMIVANPRLLYLGALTLAMSGDLERAASWVELMRREGAGGQREKPFRIALAGATVALQRDDTPQALALLDPFGIGDAEHAFERFLFNSVRVIALAASGRYDEAHRQVDRHPSRMGDSDDDLAFSADASRAVALALEGRVTEARKLASSVHSRSLAVNGSRSPFSNIAAITLAVTSYERNRVEDARRLLANRERMLHGASPLFMVWATLCESRLDQLQKSPEAALDILERQSASFRARGLERPLAFTLAEQTRLLARIGDREGANARAGELMSLFARIETFDGFYAEIPILMGLACARRDLACGDAEAALDSLLRLNGLVARLRRGRMTVVVRSVTAAALEATGREREAAAELACAVQLGSQLGLVRTFLDEGEPMRASLLRLLDGEVLAGAPLLYAEQLIGQFEPAEGRVAVDREDERAVELRPREIEIMGLVAAGMTNKRIALTLGIAPETVKWNLKNVFARIGVSNRYDALTWTRRQGLLAETGPASDRPGG